jgi:glycosyltransferase involved in cell wall biosynthesis
LAPETNPKISVIVPALNQAAFVERTLLSILNQGYPNLELIVVDGGSTDGTLEVLDRYKDHISHLSSSPDNGQSDALNRGFAKATGDIMAWMNSDDLYLPGALRAAADAFRAFPDATVIFGDWWSIDSEDRVSEICLAFDFSLGQMKYEGFHLNSQAMFWSKDAHRRFGSFDVSLHRTMDYDLIVRLGLNEGERRFVRIPAALACFRRHAAQKTTEAGADLVRREHQYIASKNGFSMKYSAIGPILRLFFRFRRLWWYIRRGGLAYTIDQAMKGGDRRNEQDGSPLKP